MEIFYLMACVHYSMDKKTWQLKGEEPLKGDASIKQSESENYETLLQQKPELLN